MCLYNLWFVSPRCFIFVRMPNGKVKQYDGEAWGENAIVMDVLATEYPMYKNVLEVKIMMK